MRVGLIAVFLSLTFVTTVAASPIGDKYAALGGPSGFLGKKVGQEIALGSGNSYQAFENGRIYYSDSAHGAFEVHGLILQHWLKLGGPLSSYGYPVSDEIDMYDKWGRVSKFQGGELIWRPSTNTVSEVKITDLQVDLPTPPGEVWAVGQTYNGVSHGGKWVYCYDFSSTLGKTEGKPIPSAADAPIIAFQDNLTSGKTNEGNSVMQRLGQARYSSSLHIKQGSYEKYAPKNQIWLGWPGRMVKSGETIAEAGDTGTDVGNYHLHYCVTTAPDRQKYAPFESVPVSFRNFEVSKNGKDWKTVSVGVPTTEDLVRRKSNWTGGAPTVNTSSEPGNFGSLEGQILMPPGYKAANGKVLISAVTLWGEPIASTYIAILPGINDAGPIKFKFGKVLDFPNLVVRATLEGDAVPISYSLSGESTKVSVAPGLTRTVNVTMKPSKLP